MCVCVRVCVCVNLIPSETAVAIEVAAQVVTMNVNKCLFHRRHVLAIVDQICVAVCCMCVAGVFSVLQCVAVCCSGCR